MPINPAIEEKIEKRIQLAIKMVKDAKIPFENVLDAAFYDIYQLGVSEGQKMSAETSQDSNDMANYKGPDKEGFENIH